LTIFGSWRSLFFYMCTDIIRFAPLKSQGIDVRARHIQEQTMQDKPPPCSPKAIYSLATAVSFGAICIGFRGNPTLKIQLRIPALRDLAFEDIRSKITKENVVTELFSGHTSRLVSTLTPARVMLKRLSLDNRQRDIAKMECELLYDKFNNEASTTKGVELIESMIGGNSAHRSRVMKLGLRRGLSASVFLRCSRSYCSLHTSPPSFCTLGSSVMCPTGHTTPGAHLECTGCGTSRTSSDNTACQGCKKRFK
jgi:hypothetical protein